MIQIGVTGHRFLAEVDRLVTGIDLALAQIDARYPREAWSVISSLAEGADRLVVERVLAFRPSSRLVVPLPVPVEDYQLDFAAESSRQEFQKLFGRASQIVQMPETPDRDEAYRAAGEYILQHAQVLVAIWDGQGAQGKGGSGEMVDAARQQSLPIAWVHAGNRRPGTQEPTSLGAEQGRVSLENFE